MALGVILGILQWVLPLLKAGVSAFTKSGLPQELITAGEAAIASLQKFITIAEPSRAEVLSLDINQDAWGVASTNTPATAKKTK